MRFPGSPTYPWYCLGAAVLALGSFLVLSSAEVPVVPRGVNRGSSTVAESSKGAAPNINQLPRLLPPASARERLGTTGSGKAAALAIRPRLVEGYGRLPMSFEINQGQTDSQVKFLSRGHGYTLFLTGDEAVLSLRSQKSGVRSQQPASRNSKLETRNPAIFNLQSEILNRQSLLPRPTDYGLPTAEAFNPKSQIQNPKSQIQNLPAPSPQPPAPTVVRLKLVGANPNARVTGLDELPGKSNYFIGNDPKKWRTNVPNYARVQYKAVYPGVDLNYYGNWGQLEYDFVVSPGADPRSIELRFSGADKLDLDGQGNLILHMAGGDVVHHAPVVYQETRGKRRKISGGYELKDNGQVGFRFTSYDASGPLIIDPVVLSYSTYLGGNGDDEGRAIAVDASGNAYVAGITSSTNFPTLNPTQATCNSCTSILTRDAFVAKLTSDGTALSYSTYLGGSNDDEGNGIAVDNAGNAYVTGSTTSTDFPTTTPFQATYGGGSQDAFVTKLNATGSALIYSTYLGGNSSDGGNGINVDASGNAYVTGVTDSTNFPTVPFGSTFGTGGGGDAFVTKLNGGGFALVYSAILGGSSGDTGTLADEGLAIAVDSFGNAYVTGDTVSNDFPTTVGALQPTCSLDAYGRCTSDAFVTKVNADGSALVYSTYLGGDGGDAGRSVAVDASGNAYVTGETNSTNFPTVNPVQPNQTPSRCGPYLGSPLCPDAFVTKLNPEGTALIYSSYVGGKYDDVGNSIVVDSAGNAYVSGFTRSTDFPIVNAVQATHGGAICDTARPTVPCPTAFIVKLGASGDQFSYSTYLGGSLAPPMGGSGDFAQGIAVDVAGSAYVTGYTYSSDFPTTPGAFQTTNGSPDAFVAKIAVTSANPLPVVRTLSPSSVEAGGADYSLSVKGINFVSNSVVRWNGSDRPTAFNGGSEVQASISASDITVAGTVEIQVFSPAPGGGLSNVMSFSINNPVAVLSTLSPNFATAGGPSFILTVNGTGFVSSSVARWNGLDRATTFVNSSQLQASISASDLSSGGSVQVTVFNPSPGGGTSNALTFTVTGNPAPSISSISPGSAIVGGSGFTLTVNGTGFVSASVVRWNGSDRMTTFVSDTQLQASIPASDIAVAGTAEVQVFNPSPGGGLSNSVSFAIVVPDFSISASPSTATITAGQSANYTLSVTPVSGFNQSVALSCTKPTQLTLATCSVSPTAVTPDGTNAATATVTVTTTARGMAPPNSGGRTAPLQRPPVGRHRGLPLQIWLLALVMLASLGGIRATRAGWKPAPAMLAAALMLVLLWVACGGGGGAAPPPPRPGTPPGTYTLTVTGTVATGSGNLSHDITLTLKVN